MNGNNATTWFLTLLVTALFSLAIGLSLGYAIWGQNDESVETVAGLPGAGPQAAPQETDVPKDTPQTENGVPQPQATPQEDTPWAARHLFIAVNGQWLAQPTKDSLAALKPGGVILRDANMQNRSQTFALVQEIKRAVGLGEGLGDLPLIAAEHEGGAVNHLGLANAPNAIDVGRADDEALARKLGQSYAQASVGRGIAIAFAPVLDVYESGSFNPALQVRTFGSNHLLVAKIGLAMEDGLRQGGVLPVVKHFPGYGASTYGPDGMLVVLNKDFGGLAKVMYPFNEAVDRNVPGILVGYTAVPALDKDDPKRPAALSPVMVTELLRNQWGYEGVIIADDIAFNPMTRELPIEQTAVQALAAGCDALVILDPNPERIASVCAAIEAAVKSGTLSRTQLDMSRARLEQWQRKLGIVQQQSNATQARAVSQPVSLSPTPVTNNPEPVISEPVSSPPPPTTRRTEESAAVTAKDETQELQVGTVAPAETDTPTTPPVIEVASTGDEVVEAQPEESQAVEIEEPLPAVDAEVAVVAKVVTPEAEAILDPPETPQPTAETGAEEEPEATDTLSPVPVMAVKLTHTVKEDETLDQIAEHYHVAAREISLWNGIETGNVKAGDVLTVFVGGEQKSEPEIVDPTNSEPEESNSTTPEPITADIETVRYVVESGDTLLKIAVQHKTTTSLLLELNKLTNPDHVWVGQRLKVPAPE